MLIKVYGASPDGAKGRYSPAECIGAEKPRLPVTRIRSTSYVLQRVLQSHDADAQPPFHPAYECLLKEIREPRAHGRDLRGLVQLDTHSQNDQVTPAMEAGLSKTLLTWEDLIAVMDAEAPKSGLRGPYKKREAA